MSFQWEIVIIIIKFILIFSANTPWLVPCYGNYGLIICTHNLHLLWSIKASCETQPARQQRNSVQYCAMELDTMQRNTIPYNTNTNTNRK